MKSGGRVAVSINHSALPEVHGTVLGISNITWSGPSPHSSTTTIWYRVRWDRDPDLDGDWREIELELLADCQ